MSELVEVLRVALAEGLEDDEVAQARDNLVRRFAVRYDGTGAVSHALVRRAHRELPDDERDTHLADLGMVRTDDATSALRDALDLDEAVVVVAGAADEVTDQLEELGIGPVAPEPRPPS